MATRAEAWAAFERARMEAHDAAQSYFFCDDRDRSEVRRAYEEKMEAFIRAEDELRRLDPTLVERW